MFGIPIHKLIVHFPIALMILAVIYDSWAFYSRKVELHEMGYRLTLWAAIGALGAVVSGLQLAGVSRIPPGEVTGHAGFGIVSSIVVTALAAARYSEHVREQRGYRLHWLVLEIGAAALVFATAVMGHKL
ncbi:MAG TPA: DUF2231 domain-containing protein [Terriglobia bacterium]|nr:DUF2231 domain-containing protein [Terriglobia bacterium]